MPARAISLAPKHIGEATVDAQSPLSFLVGFIAGIWGIDPSLAALTFVGAKIVDQSLSKGTRAIFKRDSGQSLGNQLADVLINFAGVQCGAVLREKLTAPAAAPAAGIGRAPNRSLFAPYTLTLNGHLR